MSMMTMLKTVKSVAAYKIVILVSNTIYHGFFMNLHDHEACASHSFLPLHENCPFPFLTSSKDQLTIIIRLRARVFYEQIVNEAQPSWLSLVENECE